MFSMVNQSCLPSCILFNTICLLRTPNNNSLVTDLRHTNKYFETWLKFAGHITTLTDCLNCWYWIRNMFRPLILRPAEWESDDYHLAGSQSDTSDVPELQQLHRWSTSLLAWIFLHNLCKVKSLESFNLKI